MKHNLRGFEDERQSQQTASLRRRAEQLAHERAVSNPSRLKVLSLEETQRVLHEQEVHQIELEMQNEELRVVQEALRQSEERHRLILRTAIDGFCLLDRNGQVLEVNQTYCRMSGYSEQELLTMRVSDLETGETREETGGPIQAVINRGEVRFESRHRRKDGSIFDVEVSTQYLPLEGGQIVAFLRDITDRKQAEVGLCHLAAIVGSSHDAIIGGDLEGRILSWNRAAQRMYGYTAQEVLGRSVALIVPPDRADELSAFVNRLKRGESIENLQTVRIRKDGQPIHVSLTVSPIKDLAGRVVGASTIARDISERRRLETEREKALTDYQMLFSKMIDGFALHEIILDAKGDPTDYRFLSVNPAFELHTGLRAEAVVGHTVREVLPGIEASWIEKYGRVALTGETISFEQSNGDMGRHFEVTAFSPGPKQFACVFVDITNRKEAEFELRESRRRLMEIIEATPAGYFFLTVDGCFRHVNPAWLRLHGFSCPKEIIGSHFSRTQVEADQKEAETIVARVLGGEHIQSGEFSRQIKNGSIGWHSFSATPVRHGGRIIGLEGFLIDTTERRLAQESIRQSQSELEAIYDSAPLMICLVNRQREVERMNRTMAELVAERPPLDAPRHPGDLLGCVNALDDPRGCGFGTQCEACPLRLAMVTTFETGKSCRQIEAGMFFVEGGVRRQIQVSASTALVRLKDQPRVLVYLEDITARKALQGQLLHAQKMESVGHLAGGVAHDFNNILAAIMLQLGFLRQNPNLDPETQELLKEITVGARRAANLIRQLLLFSRRSVMETKVLDLNELMANLLKMLGRLIGEHIILRFDRFEPLPTVEADPGMVEQVLMNLAVNARDAMPEGGKLTIRMQPLLADAERVRGKIEVRPGPFLCLSVTDSGCGMDEATVKRIFEPFFTTKEPGKGTGLGLATVYGIAAQHKGWVEVATELGKGSTFKVFFPATSVLLPTDRQIAEGAIIRGHETILLVEDEESVRRGVLQALGRLGYHVLEAANGEAALKLWREHVGHVDLLFSDMVMPGGLTGLNLAEKLRDQQPGLKVIISSGYNAEMAGQDRSTTEGIVYLQKPYELAVMSRAIRECLDKK